MVFTREDDAGPFCRQFVFWSVVGKTMSTRPHGKGQLYFLSGKAQNGLADLMMTLMTKNLIYLTLSVQVIQHLLPLTKRGK